MLFGRSFAPKIILIIIVVSYYTSSFAQESLSEEELKKISESISADSVTKKNYSIQTSTISSSSALEQNKSYLPSLIDMSLIFDGVATAGNKTDTLSLGAHDPKELGFHFQQLEFAFSGNVDPTFRFEGSVVLLPEEIEVEEAFITTLSLPANLQIRAGKFLTRFGKLNNTHPHSWFFVEQPLSNGVFFGGEGNRGLGTELSLLTPLPWYAEWIGSVTDDNSSAHKHDTEEASSLPELELHGEEKPADIIEHFSYTAAIKQFFPFNDNHSLFWGVSWQTTPKNENDIQTSLLGTDVYFRYKPVDSSNRTSVTAHNEWILRITDTSNPKDEWGMFSQVIWQINQNYETALRYEYVSNLENDTVMNEHLNLQQRASWQFTFYPSHFSRIRIQNNYSIPKSSDSFWTMMLSFEILTGSHGAHNY